MVRETRDHGGRLDQAIARFGGARENWLDLSTGINPVPYPVTDCSPSDWSELPDQSAFARLEEAARRTWSIPDDAAVLAAHGASALIARLPALAPAGRVRIDAPTYNEHAAAFVANGWTVVETGKYTARVLVHPNNPDGRLWNANAVDAELTVIDESFCECCPDESLVAFATRPGVVVLKSFGKFWGLAGLRLGFAIALPGTIARLRELIGPWAVSGPALRIGVEALGDRAWADATRTRLARDATRLDRLMISRGGEVVGGTTLFRLYRVDGAALWQTRLARSRIWSRIFPYANDWLRLGLPSDAGWSRLEAAL